MNKYKQKHCDKMLFTFRTLYFDWLLCLLEQIDYYTWWLTLKIDKTPQNYLNQFSLSHSRSQSMIAFRLCSRNKGSATFLAIFNNKINRSGLFSEKAIELLNMKYNSIAFLFTFVLGTENLNWIVVPYLTHKCELI